MPTFRLAAVARDGKPRPVVLVDDRMVDLQDAINAHGVSAPNVDGRLDVLPILDDWDNWLPVIRRVADTARQGSSADGARFLAPVRYPRKLLMAGANYHDHMAEMGGKSLDRNVTRPYFFMKPPTTSIIGPNEPVVIPNAVKQPDWECELVAIVGKRAKNVKRDDAMHYVAGYTVLNDISSRDLQHRKDWFGGPFQFDWMLGKCWESFAPMGPSITPREFIADVNNLRVTCIVNGETMQDSNTSNFVFDIGDMIEFLSEMFTLEPGDCISTGTPAGVGRPRGIFLQDGDVVVSEVEGVCRLETPIKREG